MKPRLITIPISHYCEKARWALDRAQIPYQEERHLQIFHLLATYRASRGDSVPVLVTDDGVIDDSTPILHWVDSKSQNPNKLFPKEAGIREDVEALENLFDEKLGTATRLWFYSFMLGEYRRFHPYSYEHQVPRIELKLMPFIYPLVKNKIGQLLHLTPQSREESSQVIEGIFKDVAVRLRDGRPFLCGSQFTAADLTFAALATPALFPDNYGVRLPSIEEFPKPMAEQIGIWRAHPAGQFALRLFREQR